MEPIVKSDIFFFISSIAVSLFTIFGIIIGIYIVRIVRNFHDMSRILQKRVQAADTEIGEILSHVHESAIFKFIFGKRKNKK